jgi:hypothetical protein
MHGDAGNIPTSFDVERRSMVGTGRRVVRTAVGSTAEALHSN